MPGWVEVSMNRMRHREAMNDAAAGARTGSLGADLDVNRCTCGDDRWALCPTVSGGRRVSQRWWHARTEVKEPLNSKPYPSCWPLHDGLERCGQKRSSLPPATCGVVFASVRESKPQIHEPLRHKSDSCAELCKSNGLTSLRLCEAGSRDTAFGTC